MLARSILLCTLALAACQRSDTAPADTAGATLPPAREPAPPPARDDSGPVFEIGLWPGEGIPVIQAVRDSLALRAVPLVRADVVARLALPAGSTIEYDSTRYQTITAATATALSAVALAGRDFGDIRSLSRTSYYDQSHPRRTLQIAAGEKVEYLQARAEGTCFVRAGQAVLEAEPCLVLDRSRFEMAAQPTLRWWIHTPGAGTPGWLLVSDSTARVARRTF